ncbi:glycerol-3-phosphate ABC transporter permease [candidate division KSB3 bacterium]|uniref:Glycerol-3-phosphate ABC transporter permease n=1 Tax=candidate division KSB3 bacterium TaxID=2044937 RepID=A0A2G6KJZ6_9BACT|nr:MAG: glycerol-3-phosphate ABC transporter permease [candidate division KSB3 bacterium]
MKSHFDNKILPYFLLLPSFLIIGYFLFYPTIETFRLSFYRLGPFGIRKIFIGWENFQELLLSPNYLNSMKVSFLFSIGVVCVGLSCSLALAVLTNQKVAGMKIYRATLIWPYALSPAIAGALFVFIFDATSGPLNYLISVIFRVKPMWLTSSSLAIWVVIAAGAWKNIGYNIVFFLAGLQNIPKDIQEAADIDGANKFQVFWKITFPILSPITFFLLIMNLIYSFFGCFGLIDVMTQGGPSASTNIMIYNLYLDAFVNHKTGLAAAESILLFLIVVILTMIQFATSGKKVHYQ